MSRWSWLGAASGDLPPHPLRTSSKTRPDSVYRVKPETFNVGIWLQVRAQAWHALKFLILTDLLRGDDSLPIWRHGDPTPPSNHSRKTWFSLIAPEFGNNLRNLSSVRYFSGIGSLAKSVGNGFQFWSPSASQFYWDDFTLYDSVCRVMRTSGTSWT